MPKLRLDRVTKQYGEKIAVDRVSAELKGGVYGLLGANGAGKTTLMRMLCGILTPSGGEVLCDGTPIDKLRGEYRRFLGYLPQNFGYYPDFTAWRYLMYLASLKAIPKAMAEMRCRELMEVAGLAGAEKQKLKTFSGGMLQRLGIAQALLNDPEILILDEPTNGLDPKERIRFRNMISTLGKNRIVLLSTHIVGDISYIADSILLMKEGRLICQGTPADLCRKAEGMVWECRVTAKEAGEASGRFLVSNVKYEGEQAVLRMIAKDMPLPGARPAEPGLEDVYLYLMEGRAEHGDISNGVL